jgi:hypothetical protein
MPGRTRQKHHESKMPEITWIMLVGGAGFEPATLGLFAEALTDFPRNTYVLSKRRPGSTLFLVR